MKARESLFAALILFTACATSRSTPPPAAELPRFSFAKLRGSEVAVVVLDQRPGERNPEWTSRTTSDISDALRKAGVNVRENASNVLEIRVLKGRSDFEDRQWNGCVELGARLTGAANVTSSGDACVAKANLWGKATADNVLRLAYADALVKLLSALDAQL